MAVLRTDQERRFGVRQLPECIVLGAGDGVTPSPKPPVRIFLGTEPAQYRAERIFIWSIEQVRDPSRTYEIYLMKDLAGFNRIGWLTGFTNYRFAIPHFAGKAGRAIYNDVDQIYLADPAELFDADMGGHGILAISPTGRLDTSVMLIDCTRMAPLWTLNRARRKRKNGLIRKARAADGAIGVLAPEWNARDEEYAPKRSKLLHYTTLHMQPWRPFPERFVYQRNSVGQLWYDLEKSADTAGYQQFSFARPSCFYADLVDHLRTIGNRPLVRGASATEKDSSADDLIAKTSAKSILEYRLGAGGGESGVSPKPTDQRNGHAVRRYNPAIPTLAETPVGKFDGVVCTGGLQYLPNADITWVIEELFRYARRFVSVRIEDHRQAKILLDGTRVVVRSRGPSWWFRQFEDLSARHPEIHWRLELETRTKAGRKKVFSRDGGSCLDDQPRVWVLTDGKPGHTTQSIGLAEALGWPYEVKDLHFTALAGVGNLLPGRLGAIRQGMVRARSDPLGPPWPDLVIATGWRASPVARWIGQQSRGRTRLVQMGRKGARVVDLFDIVVSCSYFRLPFHPRRIETTTPLNRVSQEQLRDAAERWKGLFDGAPSPRIALIVGGSSRRHYMSVELARRLGEDVREFAAAASGSVFAITSRRTGAEATEALVSGLGEAADVFRWQDGQGENPYLGYLALADILVVTGESESMLAEAAATGKPVYVYPIPERPIGLWGRLEDWVSARAHARRLNRRGTVRPQRGLDHLCARLIALGIVQPRRSVDRLHDTLFRLGIARPFGTPLETWETPALNETDDVAHSIRGLLGLNGRQPDEHIAA